MVFTDLPVKLATL